MLVRRSTVTVLCAIFAAIFVSLYFIHSSLSFRNFISYSTRPLWDAPHGPKTTIPHYYAEGISFDSHLCSLHGWSTRGAETPEVWDAVLFSSELDLLEIRMHELSSVVSKFFVLEADRTFTGLPKNLTFAAHAARFAPFADRIVHSVFRGAHVLSPGESPFVNEAAQRRHMDSILHEHARAAAVPPLVVFSDVDEIPYAHTLKLLRSCAAPTPIHLQMREYMYSFEWPAGEGSWRAQVHRLGPGSGYNHGQVADAKLADSGWHCTFCFRYLHEFVDKMTGYSHADRVTDKSLLNPDRIQRTICEGNDIFGMLPEAYRWKDLMSLMHKDSSSSAVYAPRYLLENSERFRFLLPGGCKRES